jgi:hypothetical protein
MKKGGGGGECECIKIRCLKVFKNIILWCFVL